MLWYLLILVEALRGKKKTVHIMKSMGFIKPWKVDKIMSLYIYLKIMKSFPWSKCKLSHLCFLFFLYMRVRNHDNNKENVEEAERKNEKPSPFLFAPLSISFLVLFSSSPHRRLLDFHFLQNNSSFFLFSHFLNTHTGTVMTQLACVLTIGIFICDLKLVFSCWTLTM